MKVLHLLDSLNRGGAEMQALDTARNAGRFGIELTIVSAGPGMLQTDFASSGVQFIPLRRKLPVDLYLASQIRSIIRDRKIQLVRGFQPVDGLHLYLASRGLRDVRQVLSFEGFIPDRKNRLTAKFLIPKMHANIVVSRGLKKWLAEKDGLDTNKFNVIHNGADPERLKPAARTLRKELNITGNELIFGMIGNFYRDPRKDQLTLAKALPRIFDRYPHAHCIFAGGVETGAEDKMAECLDICLQQGLTERVHFLGSRGDVPNILAEMDIFIFSSLQEGLPVAASEAMLAGVPMIVSDIEPLLEATGGGEFAAVFPVGDANTLAEKTIHLLQNDAERLALGAKAKEFAQANFSIDSHLRDLKRLYAGLIT